MFSYKQLIVSAATFAWRYKYLWFFGLFGALLTNSGVFQRIYANDVGGGLQDWQRLKDTGVFEVINIRALGALAAADPVWFGLRVAVLLAVVGLGAFIFWLSVVSQGAIIQSVVAMEGKKKPTFRATLQSGMRTFWSVLWLRVVGEKGLMVALLFVAGVLSAYALQSDMGLAWRIAALGGFVLTLGAVFAVILTMRYAMSYAVIEGTPLVAALGRGIDLLRRNVWISIEAGAVIFMMNVVLGFAVLIAIAAIAIPCVLLLAFFYQLQFVAGFTFVLVVGTALLVAAVMCASAAITVFSEALWTLFFIRVSKEALPNHLYNLFGLLARR